MEDVEDGQPVLDNRFQGLHKRAIRQRFRPDRDLSLFYHTRMSTREIALNPGEVTFVDGCELSLVWCVKEEAAEETQEVVEEEEGKQIPNSCDSNLVVAGGFNADSRSVN